MSRSYFKVTFNVNQGSSWGHLKVTVFPWLIRTGLVFHLCYSIVDIFNVTLAESYNLKAYGRFNSFINVISQSYN